MTDISLFESDLESAGFGEDLDEGYFDEESYDEGESSLFEGMDGEESAATRRRRRRVRAKRREQALRAKRAAARRKMRAGRPGGPPSTRAAVAAVRDLGLKTEVKDDEQRRAIADLAKRQDRAHYTALAGVGSAVAQNSLKGRFPALNNPYVGALLTAAPLLLLSPPSKPRTGPTALLTDPRFAGPALALGLAFAGDRLTRTASTQSIDLNAPTVLEDGATDVAIADALDGKGVIIQGKVFEFESSDPSKATIDKASGAIVAVDPGSTVLSAKVDGLVKRSRLTVTAVVVPTP